MFLRCNWDYAIEVVRKGKRPHKSGTVSACGRNGNPRVDIKEGAEAHRALADPGRLRLFNLILESDRPLDIYELADAMKLHPNTVRSHLRRLELVELVVPEIQARAARGRPRVLFKPGPRAEEMAPGGRNYKLLATMLAGFLNAELADPQSRAEQAGRAWGGYLSAPYRPHPADPVDLDAAAGMMVRMMDRLGFEPELKASEDGADLHLHHCPFREIAARYPGTVCAMHLGLLKGALADARAGAEATELLPFVEPSLCIARLQARPRAS